MIKKMIFIITMLSLLIVFNGCTRYDAQIVVDFVDGTTRTYYCREILGPKKSIVVANGMSGTLTVCCGDRDDQVEFFLHLVKDVRIANIKRSK